jgi:hypothetical protein
VEALAKAGGPDYVVRYRWNRDTAKGVVACVLFCAVMALIPAPLWARILVIGIFGSIIVMVVGASILRTTVLRLDESGVTTRRSWLRSRTECYPWSAIEALVIWSSGRVRTVGVQCHEGAPPLVGPPRAGMRALLSRDAPGIPPNIAITGITISAWCLDTARLLAAVDHFAPSVHVVDVSAGDILRQGRPA